MSAFERLLSNAGQFLEYGAYGGIALIVAYAALLTARAARKQSESPGLPTDLPRRYFVLSVFGIIAMIFTEAARMYNNLNHATEISKLQSERDRTAIALAEANDRNAIALAEAHDRHAIALAEAHDRMAAALLTIRELEKHLATSNNHAGAIVSQSAPTTYYATAARTDMHQVRAGLANMTNDATRAREALSAAATQAAKARATLAAVIKVPLAHIP